MALHVTDANFAAEAGGGPAGAGRFLVVPALQGTTLIVSKQGQPVDLKVGAGQTRVPLIKWLEAHAA